MPEEAKKGEMFYVELTQDGYFFNHLPVEQKCSSLMKRLWGQKPVHGLASNGGLFTPLFCNFHCI